MVDFYTDWCAWCARLESDTRQESGTSERVFLNRVDEGFWEVFDLQVLQGRLPAGTPGTEGVEEAVVGRSFAQGREDPEGVLGRRFRLAAGPDRSARELQVVGIVEDFPMPRHTRKVPGQVYLALASGVPGRLTVILRSGQGSEPPAELLRRTVSRIGPDIPVQEPTTWAAFAAFMRQFYDTVGTLGLAGGLGALVIALSGLYGLLAFQVRRRTREMGLRMALGADRGRMLRHILWKGARFQVPGLLLGLLIAWLVTPPMGPMLLTDRPHAPGPLLAVVGLLMLCGLAASLAPALRAARIAPARILREEEMG